MNEPLQRRFETIPERVNGDRALVHRGRRLTPTPKASAAPPPSLLYTRGGEIQSPAPPPPLFAAADLMIEATEEAWAALWETYPRPGWHDIFALTKRGAMRVEGDSHVLFAHLQYLKDVLTTPRRAHVL